MTKLWIIIYNYHVNFWKVSKDLINGLWSKKGFQIFERMHPILYKTLLVSYLKHSYPPDTKKTIIFHAFQTFLSTNDVKKSESSSIYYDMFSLMIVKMKIRLSYFWNIVYWSLEDWSWRFYAVEINKWKNIKPRSCPPSSPKSRTESSCKHSESNKESILWYISKPYVTIWFVSFMR